MTRQRRRRIIKVRRKLTGIVAVAAISFVAGMTDAIGFLMSGDFVSFMTGNTTRAAIYLGEGDLAHAAILLATIGLFVIGNASGIVVAHLTSRRMFTVLAFVSILLAIASILRDPALGLAQFALVVMAMGMVNAAVEHVEGLPIGLTYVTGALSRFGRGIGRWLIGDRRLDWTIQIVPWLGMLAGAIGGAFLAATWKSDALWVVSAITMVLALAALWIPPPLQQRFNQPTTLPPPVQHR